VMADIIDWIDARLPREQRMEIPVAT